MMRVLALRQIHFPKSGPLSHSGVVNEYPRVETQVQIRSPGGIGIQQPGSEAHDKRGHVVDFVRPETGVGDPSLK